MAEFRDPFIDQIAAELKRPVRFDARFDERVMDALNAPEVIPLHPTRQAGRRPWIMRRRTQGEMDQLVEAAGFQKLGQRIDEWGVFTVSIAERVAG